jgi:SAM-dependent methyltransferase
MSAPEACLSASSASIRFASRYAVSRFMGIRRLPPFSKRRHALSDWQMGLYTRSTRPSRNESGGAALRWAGGSGVWTKSRRVPCSSTASRRREDAASGSRIFVAMNAVTEETYDRIGAGYGGKRRADPRIAKRIGDALGPAVTLVNVGAGTGSYEPTDRVVIAVEPAMTMIHQRSKDAGPVVRGYAEKLPFRHGTFDAALAILTIHHWKDWRAGLRELARVARERVVLFTWDPRAEGFWLRDYLPEIFEKDRQRFPDPQAMCGLLGGAEVHSVPIPHDCTDGFMGAYWRRPWAYLEPNVRAAISSFATDSAPSGLARLAQDLDTGDWHRKYESILQQEELDLGYRIIICGTPSPGERTLPRPSQNCGRPVSARGEPSESDGRLRRRLSRSAGSCGWP